MSELTVPVEETGPKPPEATSQTPEPNPQAQPPAVPQQPPPAPQQEPSAEQSAFDKAAAGFVQQAGLDVEALSKQIAETGSIDAAAQAKIADVVSKAGLSKEEAEKAVRDYIGSKKEAHDARTMAFVREMQDMVGGEESYRAMGEWARANMTPEEVKTFSDLCQTGDANVVRFAIQSIAARYRAENRIPGKLTKGGTAAASSGNAFRSREQQIAAQMDPRYASDPAFREEVREKIRKAKQLGLY